MKLGEVTLVATAKVRSDLTWQHLNAASLFSRQVGELEVEHSSEAVGAFFEDIFSYATGAVMCATAGLEAFANQIFADRTTHFENFSERFLDEVWEKFIDRMSILDKLSFALLMKHHVPYDKGHKLYQEASALIALRNGLVHFKPEWSDELDIQATLSKKLSSTLKPSRFLPNEPGLFPRAWASHANTRWAVATSVNIIEDVAIRLGLSRQLADHFKSVPT